jgi:hypothetical protein
VLLTPTVHAAILLGGLVATVLTGLSMRRRQTALALLLWVVPFATALSFADLLLMGLGPLWPAAPIDGGPGDAWRVPLVALAMLVPAEVLHHWTAARLAGAGVTRHAAS